MFRYDGLDRLVSADYTGSAVSGPDTDAGLTLLNERDYSCAYGYDLNGNITSLRRNGVSDAVSANGKSLWTFGTIDDVAFAYDGNQLKKAVDRADELTYSGAMDFKDRADDATEYAYDANGNMTCDRNRKIRCISYNILNLPSEVVFDDGHIVRYTYDAGGTKHKAEYLLGNERLINRETGEPDSDDYFIGEDSGNGIFGAVSQMTLQYSVGHVYRNGVLERVDNGYCYWADGTFHYNISDYQGNIRAVVAENHKNLNKMFCHKYRICR